MNAAPKSSPRLGRANLFGRANPPGEPPATANLLGRANPLPGRSLAKPGPGEPPPHHPPPNLHPTPRRGFSLLEMLVAVVLLATAFTIIWSTFSATINAWQAGRKFVDEFHHGDFVLEQVVSALRSTAYFQNRPDKFGFWLETGGSGSYPRDQISFVKSGTAFMMPGHPLAQGLHRVVLGIENDTRGRPSFTVRAFPHLLDEPEPKDFDPWHISSRVRGFQCRVYNFEDERWDDEWEDTNSVPRLVEVTVFMEPPKSYEPPLQMTRLIEIPLAPAVTGAVQVGEADTRPSRQQRPTDREPVPGQENRRRTQPEPRTQP